MLVGWSGTVVFARAALAEFRARYQEAQPKTKDEIRSIIDELEPEGCSLIYMICDATRYQICHDNAEIRVLSSGEEIVVMGSGSNHVQEALDRELSHEEGAPSTGKAVARVFSTVARLWHWDLMGSSTQLAFGGGYEAAFQWKDQLIKADDTLYMNFLYEKGTLGPMGVFKKVDYVDDIFVLRVFEIRNKSPDMSIIDLDWHRGIMYFIPALDNQKPDVTEEFILRLPDLNATNYATHIVVKSAVESTAPHSITMTNSYKDRQGPIVFEQPSPLSRIESIALSNEYLNTIAESAERLLVKAGG